MAAWIKQIAAQVAKHGADKASWHCEWDEPTGARRSKSCGPGRKGKRDAEAMRDKINTELRMGTYESAELSRVTWDEFLKRYREVILSGKRPTSQIVFEISLAHFARILNLSGKRVNCITEEKIDTFRAARRLEKGRKPKSLVSPATINRDLRAVKAALRKAVKWGWLKKMPDITFENEPEKLPNYVTPEHFKLIFENCKAARFPNDGHYTTEDWWQGLLVMAQMTGWRISELLALKWADVDLDAGTAITRARDNKGKRDGKVILHPIALLYLRKLKAFHTNVFPWEHHRRTLDVEFARIQDAAGIKINCTDQRPHKCTDACRRYSFHDERRAFATMNAMNMTREALQALMRHSSPETTARYINMANQISPAVATLHVPEVLQSKQATG